MLPGMDDCPDDMVRADTVFHLSKHEWPAARIFFVALHRLQIRAHARSEIRLVDDAFGRFMEDLCSLCHAGLIFFTTFFAKTKGNDATSNIQLKNTAPGHEFYCSRGAGPAVSAAGDGLPTRCVDLEAKPKSERGRLPDLLRPGQPHLHQFQRFRQCHQRHHFRTAGGGDLFF